jgi:hypothetical protein
MLELRFQMSVGKMKRVLTKACVKKSLAIPLHCRWMTFSTSGEKKIIVTGVRDSWSGECKLSWKGRFLLKDICTLLKVMIVP